MRYITKGRKVTRKRQEKSNIDNRKKMHRELTYQNIKIICKYMLIESNKTHKGIS